MSKQPDRDGILFVVSAPSGAGKTSLCRELIDKVPDLRQSISFATRSMRQGEQQNVDYHFVARGTFQRMIDAHQLAEWAEVHGHLYGTSRETLETARRGGSDLLLDIDCQGAAQLKKNYSEGVFIFILPPDVAELERRLRGRGTDEAGEINRRLTNAVAEMREAAWYDYLVINDHFSDALERLEAIVLAERCRAQRNIKLLKPLMGD